MGSTLISDEVRNQNAIRRERAKPFDQAAYDAETVSVPVIASGGAGTLEHLVEVLTTGKADAVLAASIFHFGTFTVPETKAYLKSKSIPVR